MSIDRKILSEIQRYRSIDNYILEQEAAPPPVDAALPPEGGAPPPPPPAAGEVPAEAPAEPIDVENDPDVEKIDDEGESEEKDKDKDSEGSEELDITDLVNAQKDIQSKQDDYFDNLFGQLGKLESRLGEMDAIMNKLNALENKIEKYREKTPQEKLELRSYDSYPFNQKLSQFFDDKTDEMEKTGKNEYVLTSDDVTDINVNDIQNSFQNKSNDINDKFKYR